MAIGIEYNTSDTVEGKKGSSTNLVIDLSKIEGLLREGKTTDELKNKINARAEHEVSTDLATIKQTLSQGKNFDQAMDFEFSKNDSADLISILQEYTSVVKETKYSLADLAAQINFQLTDVGNTKVNSTNIKPEDCIDNNPTTKPTASFGNVPATGNQDCAPNAPKPGVDKPTVSAEFKNQLASYRPQNIRCGSDDLKSRDVVATKSNARTALRDWIRGRDEKLSFVAEGDRVGDELINLATKDDKAILKESLYKPLKILCVNNQEGFGSVLRRKVSVDGLDESKVWGKLMSTYNTSKGNLQSESYREGVANSPEFTVLGGKADNFAKWMVKLGTLYSDYRDGKYNGGYIEKLMGTLDTEFKINNDDFEDVKDKKGYERIVDAHNRNNDAIKNINLGGHKILDKKSDTNKAHEGLISMGANLSEATAYGQSLVETHNIKALVDNAAFASFGEGAPSTTNEEGFMNFLADTSFSGGVDNSDMAMRQGQQMLAQFRTAVAQYAYMNNKDLNIPAESKQAQDAVLRNIVSFVAKQAKYNPDPTYSKVATELTKAKGKEGNIGQYLIGDKEHGGSASGSFLSENPGMLKFMQKTLTNYPGSMDGIMLYGDLQNGSDSGESRMQAEYRNAPSEKTKIEGLTSTQNAFFNEIHKNNPATINAFIKKSRELNADPAINDQQLLRSVALSTIRLLSKDISAYYLGGDIQKVVKSLTNDVDVDVKGDPHKATIGGVSLEGSLGMGGAIALAKNIKLVYGLATDGASIMPALSIAANQNLGAGVRMGESMDIIVPGGSGTLTKTIQGKDKTGGTLDTVALTSTTLGVDAGMNVIGASAGVGFFREKDILGGIDTGYEHRKSKGAAIIKSLLTSIDPKTLTSSTDLHDAITNQININYAKGSPEEKKLMIDNLHAAMLSLGCGLVGSTIDKTVLEQQLAQTFAGEWKNQAIAGLKGSKLTGWGMRLGINTNPRANALNIFTLGTSFKFTNFKRGHHYEDTAESQYDLKSAEFEGKNNRRLSHIIGPKEVALMNNMFKTNHHRMMHKVSDIQHDANTNTIRIPKALWEGQGQVNVKLDPKLMGKIKMDEQGYLVVPANIDMSIDAFPQVSGVGYVLSLGSASVQPGALHLITGREIPTGREAKNLADVQYEGEKGNPLTVADVATLVNKLKAKNNAYKDFNVKVLSADNTTVKFEIGGQKLELPAQGGGTIVLDAGKFSIVPAKMGLNNKFILSFENKTAGGTTPGKPTDVSESITFNEIDTDLEQKAIEELNLPANLKLIESLENVKSDQFYYFLDSVMVRDTGAAAEQLLNMLDYTGAKGKLPELKKVLTSGTPAEKDAIVSHMLSIFAIEEQSYKKKTIKDLIAHRDGTSKTPAYMRIGNNKLTFLTRDDFSNAEFDMTLKPGANNGESETDLLGYTAFYRNPKRGTAHRGFALTTPGYTKTLGGSQAIPEGKVSQAKEWLKTQMTTDKFAKRAIGDALRKKPGLTTITDDQAFQLTQGDPITIGDNTITLNSQPVFYFLAECANESIGLKIQSITIKKPGQPGVVIDGNLTTDSESLNFNPGSGGGLFVNTTETRGVAAISGARSFQVGGGIAAKVGKKEEEGFNDGLGAETNPGKKDTRIAEPPKSVPVTTNNGKTDTQTTQAPSNSSAS